MWEEVLIQLQSDAFPDDVFCDVIREKKKKKRGKNADAVLLLQFHVVLCTSSNGNDWIKCKSECRLRFLTE